MRRIMSGVVGLGVVVIMTLLVGVPAGKKPPRRTDG